MVSARRQSAEDTDRVGETLALASSETLELVFRLFVFHTATTTCGDTSIVVNSVDEQPRRRWIGLIKLDGFYYSLARKRSCS